MTILLAETTTHEVRLGFGAALDSTRRAQPVDLARLAADAADRWLQPSLQAGQDLGFELTKVLGHGSDTAAPIVLPTAPSLPGSPLAGAGRRPADGHHELPRQRLAARRQLDRVDLTQTPAL